MNTTFELPTRKNSLVEAYEESKESRETPVEQDLNELYVQHFISTVPPITERPPRFDYVSLANPAIRTVLQSNTTIA